VTVRTPLLVPSFSSKGFKAPELRTIFSSSGAFITETYLISAYDIEHGHLPEPRNLPFKPELLFLDSGGYEISKDQDISAVEIAQPGRNEWSSGRLIKVLDNWPDEIATVLVNYDHPHERMPFSDQVKAARELFKGRSHLCTFIIKPQTPDEDTLNSALAEAMVHADELQSFDIVGVTEKEIGRSALERMVKIAKLRMAMDARGVRSPIHVFGALDPLSACLYFLAGAEIFDGLTWIRYAYDERGRCVYGSNHGAIKFGLDVRENEIKTRFMAENIYLLQQLQRKLREFEVKGQFAKLEPHAKLLENAADALETALQKGGY
jgi:hypothetical protein